MTRGYSAHVYITFCKELKKLSIMDFLKQFDTEFLWKTV